MKYYVIICTEDLTDSFKKVIGIFDNKEKANNWLTKNCMEDKWRRGHYNYLGNWFHVHEAELLK